MVPVATEVPSARTVALVLAVLGYRRRLRRRDRWSRAALVAHQDRALGRLRKYAYQRSRFYQDFHAGLASAPLSTLPVLTKQTLMEVVTLPVCGVADVEDYLAMLRVTSCSRAGTSCPQRRALRGYRESSCGTSGSGCRLSPRTTGSSTGPAQPPAWLTESRQPVSVQPIPATSRLVSGPPFTVAGCPRFALIR
jgi:hypothetical protein